MASEFKPVPKPKRNGRVQGNEEGILRRQMADGTLKYYARVWFEKHDYRHPAEGGPKEAKQLRDRLNAEIRKGTYLPPKKRKEAKQDKARAAQAKRGALDYQNAVERFLKAEGETYSAPAEVRTRLERMGLYFNGRTLDTITPRDVERFRDARLNNTGPYARTKFPDTKRKIKRKPSLRTPQLEVNLLSSLYGFVIEEGHEDLSNPCLVRSRRNRRKKKLTYVPSRKKVIPTPQAVRAILEAEAPRLSDTHRAFWTLAYYTGGRPESELCTITHGDVTLPHPLRSVNSEAALGTVTFRRTKTGKDRTLPLHPEAAEALRSIMDPKAKPGMPIFSKRSKQGGPWDKASYKKAWALTMGAVAEQHPELAGMWVRDFRATFRTVLTDAKVPGPTIRRLMGHASDVSEGYYELTEEAAQSAVRALTVPAREAQRKVGAA